MSVAASVALLVVLLVAPQLSFAADTVRWQGTPTYSETPLRPTPSRDPKLDSSILALSRAQQQRGAAWKEGFDTGAMIIKDDWLAHPGVRVVQETEEHVQLWSELLRGAGSGGDLTTDA